MEDKKNNNGTFLYLMLGVFVLLIIVAIIGFVFFINRKVEVVEEEENGGNIILNYTNSFSGLKLSNLIPLTDSVGMTSLIDGYYFDFSVDVSLDNATAIEYEISVKKDSLNSSISDDDIRLYLEKEESGTYTSVFGPLKFTPIVQKTALGTERGDMVLYNVRKTKSSHDNYRFRMWLSDQSLLSNGSYSVNVFVKGQAK